jgi:hypothetical protein
MDFRPLSPVISVKWQVTIVTYMNDFDDSEFTISFYQKTNRSHVEGIAL